MPGRPTKTSDPRFIGRVDVTFTAADQDAWDALTEIATARHRQKPDTLRALIREEHARQTARTERLRARSQASAADARQKDGEDR